MKIARLGADPQTNQQQVSLPTRSSGERRLLRIRGAEGFKKRKEAYSRHHKVDDAPFYLMPAMMNLVVDHKKLIAEIREHNATAALSCSIRSIDRSSDPRAKM